MEFNMARDILKISEIMRVENYEFHKYESQNPAASTNNKKIWIDIMTHAVFTHSVKLCLSWEETDIARRYNGHQHHCVNNFISYMLSQIYNSINEKEIENISCPGQTKLRTSAALAKPPPW